MSFRIANVINFFDIRNYLLSFLNLFVYLRRNGEICEGVDFES